MEGSKTLVLCTEPYITSGKYKLAYMTTTDSLQWVKYTFTFNLCCLSTWIYIMILLDPAFTILSIQHTLCMYSYLICLLTQLHSATYISRHVSYSPINGWLLDQWHARVCVYVYVCICACIYVYMYACMHTSIVCIPAHTIYVSQYLLPVFQICSVFYIYHMDMPHFLIIFTCSWSDLFLHICQLHHLIW
jgi:hypothetical protein